MKGVFQGGVLCVCVCVCGGGSLFGLVFCFVLFCFLVCLFVLSPIFLGLHLQQMEVPRLGV